MNKKIGIIAGTPVDSEFGVNFLKSIGFENILYHSISKNPQEQNDLQLNNKEILFNICYEKCIEFKNNGINIVLIYCNSLSGVLDLEKLEKITGIKIITPLDVYSNIETKNTKSILLITANASGAIIPEKIIRKQFDKINIINIGYLELVNQIEQKNNPENIIINTGLIDILSFAKSINIDTIILGCTHFPYITKTLKKYCDINIIDLDDKLKILIEKKFKSI